MVLITGATGLLGHYLLTNLLAEGKTVKALYNRTLPDQAAYQAAAGQLTWIQCDILDVPELIEAMEGVTQVYHTAAIVSFNPKKKKLLFQTNIEGTANVVNAALHTGVKKMVYVSSVAALGRMREGETVNETMNWTEETSNSSYGKSKYLGEMEVWRGIGEGLDAVMVNPSIILGAGDWGKGSSEIFKTAYDEFPWYTEGVSGFVDVQDVVRAMIQLMESDISAERFILSGSNQSYRHVFTSIANAFGKKPPKRKVTAFLANLVWRLEALKSRFTGKDPLLTRETAQTARAKVFFDNGKIQQFLPGFTFTPFEQTIEQYVSIYKQRLR
jgi:dihydroflavonol-4-reductase